MALKFVTSLETPLKTEEKPIAVGQKIVAVAEGSGTQMAMAVEQIVSTEVVEKTEEDLLTEEYIRLYLKLEDAEVSQTQKRMEEIKKSLHSIANSEIADDSPAVFKCSLGEVEFSKRSENKVFGDPTEMLNDMVEKFGQEAIMKVVKIGVTEAGKLFSENELKKYYKLEPGSRSLKGVRPKRVQ